jgi:hypothetical protein
VTEIVTVGFKVTVAVADTVDLAKLVAVIVTVWAAKIVTGAV